MATVRCVRPASRAHICYRSNTHMTFARRTRRLSFARSSLARVRSLGSVRGAGGPIGQRHRADGQHVQVATVRGWRRWRLFDGLTASARVPIIGSRVADGAQPLGFVTHQVATGGEALIRLLRIRITPKDPKASPSIHRAESSRGGKSRIVFFGRASNEALSASPPSHRHRRYPP